MTTCPTLGGHWYGCCARCSSGVKKDVFALSEHMLYSGHLVVRCFGDARLRPKVLAYIVCICNVLCMIFRLRSSETDA
jgi:hypothetical protein